MRKAECAICHEQVAQVDLRATLGRDPRVLATEEEGQAYKLGVEHVMNVHEAVAQLAINKGKSAFDLIHVGRFEPLDTQSCLPVDSWLT